MKKLIAAVCLLYSIIGFAQAQEWKVKVGEEAPAFHIQGRKEAIPSSSLKGKVVLLNFFATWCPPCRKELPRLQAELHEALKEDPNFAIFVLGREEDWSKLDPFMAQNKYTFPVFPDLQRKVFGLFAESSIPRNVVLDRNGKIIYQSIGFTDEEFSQMVSLIKAELKKK